jgi:hypothetical protein
MSSFRSIQALQSVKSVCIPVEKKCLRLSAQPLVHRLLYLFIRVELLSSHRLFERPKLVVITAGLGLVSVADVEDTHSASLGLLQLLHGQYGAEHCRLAKGHL